MTVKELKALIDKQVFLIPRGNSVDRYKRVDEQIIEGTLKKARGVRATLEGKEESFNIYGELDKNNYGYSLYPTKTHASNSLNGNPIQLGYFDYGAMELKDYITLQEISKKYKELK